MALLACVAALGPADVAAAAAPAAGDRAAAEALFDEARALVEAGDFAAGCPKFAASMKLYAATSTALNLARCHEHAGELVAARDAYHQALAHNGETRGARRRKGLEALANDGIAALAPRLPRLRVVVEGAPARLAVTRDGQPLPADALGQAQPVDPGSHEIHASAPGHQPVRRVVELAEGETETVTLQLAPIRPADPAAEPRGKPRRRAVPAWAWATGALGLGLAGASVYFLVDDLAAIDALKTHCRDVPGGTYCDPDYEFAADNARKNRDLGLFIGLGSAGLVAITAAVVGIVRASPAKQKPARRAAAGPWLAPGGGGLNIGGRF
ncbi:carboxypeptidase-like regulatory domain-containing protein [Nannocystis pusilla]|uniref:Carboxypeptidase-like regulatory domain-containing protein n=1 Tax=Nannocystis pusilla TaxID=889268 RepID=A0ABS7U2Z4_9BACT|nr:carboxypeptidase-like regulatory domain-containing protein [Nannocystis pusilla]MBZ5714676.1 carboxypeptidase-like regulatory domain-containing protein [Nannocystis pusilla]